MDSDNSLQLVALAGSCYLAVLAALSLQSDNRQPPRCRYRPPGVPTTLTAPLQGYEETRRLLLGPDQYCFSTTRLHKPILIALVEKLTSSFGLAGGRQISAAEAVVVFLQHCAHKTSYRQLRREYQHSTRTIHGLIHRVSRLLCRLYLENVTLPSNNETPARLRTDPKFWPFFGGAFGALDGTHVPIRLKGVANAGAYRNRKGGLSQNVLAVCDFNGRFVFAQAGYEGSVNDGTVLRKAQGHGLTAATGRYYLADGGYSLSNKLVLVPYQKTRYHLREQAATGKRPETKEELFNLRHAQFRNVIECVFGVFKARWSVIREGPQQGYSVRMHARFVIALMAVHNFMIDSGQTFRVDRLIAEAEVVAEVVAVEEGADLGFNHDQEMIVMRERIAREAWAAYSGFAEVDRGLGLEELADSAEVEEIDA